jgi:hypothetical protein
MKLTQREAATIAYALTALSISKEIKIKVSPEEMADLGVRVMLNALAEEMKEEVK